MRIFFFFVLLIFANNSNAQLTTSIRVNGDSDKFYPVVFNDPGWNQNTPTVLTIGKSDVHFNGNWSGSVMATFTYHTNNWGHGSHFIDVTMNSLFNSSPLIAGWEDATTSNGNQQIIIWLKGAYSYSINSRFTISPVVYDGIQNPLPFQEQNGGVKGVKLGIDSYANQMGLSSTGTAHFRGTGHSYFLGNVGIGTSSPTERLSVNGSIRAREVKVESINWPDYVFSKDYKLLPLESIEQMINANGHLPGIPSAEEIKTDGLKVGEMSALLLKKIEELTLHLIELKKENKAIKNKVKQLENKENKKIK